MKEFNEEFNEDFNEEFTRFLNLYKKGLENLLNGLYDYDTKNIQPLDNNLFNQIMKDLSENKKTISGSDDSGVWEKSEWVSPDGLTYFNSFTKSYYGDKHVNKKTNEQDTITLLENELNKAVIDERYEDAAKIRDLIQSFKSDK